MKHYLTAIIAMMSAAALAVSCSEKNAEDFPKIEFARPLYSVVTGGETSIVATVTKAPQSAITIPLAFAETGAAADADYKVSAKEIQIPAGETSGQITFTNINMSESAEVRISFAAVPQGYEQTTKNFTLVTPSQESAIVYNFSFESGDVLESFIAKIELKTAQGEKFSATEEMNIPAVLSGEGASLVTAGNNGNFIVKAGEDNASLTLKLNDDTYSGAAPLTLGIENSGRFIKGDRPSMDLTVRGLLSPENLLGEWTFSETLNLKDVNDFFIEMEDDPELLPTHNEGFTLTFAKNDKGYTVTPSGKGDWMNYFREAEISHTAPMNMTSGAWVLGAYSSDENQMFTAIVDTPRQQITYFKLSNVNRAFDAENEKLGEGTIAMRIRKDGKLEIYLKDYDTPPFGFMWWDPGYDPDMFSFASTFTKVK